MTRLDLVEVQDLRRLCLVDTIGDAIDDRLERNLRQRKVGRSCDKSAGKDAEIPATRDLEHRLQCERAAATEKADQAGMAAGIGGGSWSMVLALILPLYGRWIDAKLYVPIFVTMSLLPLAGSLIFIWLSRGYFPISASASLATRKESTPAGIPQ